ncbi:MULTISPECIES: cytochrome b [Burkholderia]|uniref:Cytochrome B561 n=1 Tax=Burkholderia contaminans TaxID=488447 RepID=A0A6P3AJA3_9BURK|nr:MULTISPECIES: cytochrome b/b6 domain-containing protein [Burkholderia]MBN3730975.1 cytochrome b [Burkholderia sp. Tr-20390]MDN7489001.1 cytochrome b/b6 domain-containing protein [Burkholderia sp. AU45274]OXJ07575.1 cytochrome b [Burkholderia sp. HI2500]OXJ08649.1 cytochrome b [Burkholderia sp. AU6039]VWD47014.1 cytochrome B561 [Burkholderia contaminans]
MSHPNHVAYTRFAIAMHWSIAILILLNLMIGIYMDTFPHNSSQFNGILFYHASIGSLIFMLTVPRLAWRATHTPPPLPASVPAWQARIAGALHGVLYLLLCLVPLTGYVHRLAGAHPVSFFGITELPVLVGRDEPLRLLTDSLHRALVLTLGLLLVMHVAAGLKHKFVDRDGVAERMGI